MSNPGNNLGGPSIFNGPTPGFIGNHGGVEQNMAPPLEMQHPPNLHR